MNKIYAAYIIKELRDREQVKANLRAKLIETFEFIDPAKVKGKHGIVKQWRMKKVHVYQAMGIDYTNGSALLRGLLKEFNVIAIEVFDPSIDEHWGADYFLGLRLKQPAQQTACSA